MSTKKNCDICGKPDSACVEKLIKDSRKQTVHIQHVCSKCATLTEAFIYCLKEGTLAVGLLDYLISVYGEEELKKMLEQRGDKNGGTKN